MSDTTSSHLKRLLPYMLRYRRRLIGALFLILAGRALMVASPYVIKEIVDTLSVGIPDDLGIIGLFIVLFFVLRWGTDLLNGANEYLFAVINVGVKRSISYDIVQHLLTLPLSFYTEQATGGVSRMITRGTGSLSNLSFFLVGTLIPTVFEILLVLGVLLYLFPPSFSLVFLAFVGVYAWYTIVMTERRQAVLLEANSRDDKSGARYIDALMNIETVKYFTNEEYEKRRYNDSLESWSEMAIDSGRKSATLNIGQGFILAVGLTILLALTVREFVTGGATVGDFILIISYLNRISIPLSFLGFLYRTLKESFANIDAMFRLFDSAPSIADRDDARVLEVSQGEIALKNVRFGYREDREILHGLSLIFEGHKRTALVGYSGSGKSTISKLVPRLYDVTGGAITIDGVDIREVTQDSLRAQIGVVAQDTVLFNESILHNISYGNPDASREDIENVAKLANIHDFIMSLPQGYETEVGERGVKLSGGEKQRVAIARMLLKNPPIVIFDEATASLDSASEKMIQQAIADISQEGKTTIVIAHRLSTIVDFDRIVVMQDGEVVDQGRHHQLLESSMVYQALWNIQSKEE